MIFAFFLFGMRLDGISAYAPENVWSNARVAARLRLERMRLRASGEGPLGPEVAELFETSDRWVRRFIGLQGAALLRGERGHIDLAVGAARQLLERSGARPGDIEAIVVGSVTPSYLFSPPDAALLQHELGIPVWQGSAPRELTGADVSLACSSWVTSLMFCYALIRAGLARRILLVGADRMSSAINWRDRSFATVLGDVGTAVLCTAVPEDEDWFDPSQFWSWLDGARADIIMTPAGGSRRPALSPQEINAGKHRLAMDGAAVRKTLVPFMGGPAVEAALTKAKWSLEDLDVVALHAAISRSTRDRSDVARPWLSRSGARRGWPFRQHHQRVDPARPGFEFRRVVDGPEFGLFGFGGGLSACFALGTIRHPLPAWTNLV